MHRETAGYPAVFFSAADCVTVPPLIGDMDSNMSDTASRALPVQDARIYPRGGLDVLSRAEVARLRDASSGGMHELLRRCALAVLTSGSAIG